MALAATSLSVFSAGSAQAADPIEIQILGTNDFHGRLQENAFGGEAGAAVLAGAVKELRAENPNTVFAAAGDLIGASTFESFIQQDKPTIDALNEAGLDVSAVGNHELDQGFDDLNTRVQDLADWEYIAANLRLKVDNTHPFAPTYTQEFGDVKVGFVGAVTEDLPSLVSPSGIDNLDVTDIVDEVNDATTDLKADGADVVVMLVHEGSPTTDCETMDDSGTWADIINGVNDDVDAIVSGHTHLAYNCSFDVPGWTGRAVTDRPVVSAGQYGQNLNQLIFSVDPDTGDVAGLEQNLLPLLGNYPADPAVETIVADAVAEADELGAAPLGEIAGPFKRARLANGTTENRGGESTLGNLVAEVQRDATEAQIAFMNPGGLRADMLGQNEGGYPATLTYKQAAEVQPFANTLVKMDLTGDQVKSLLEEQWQPDGSSRPFLRLGSSAGFEYSYDPTAPAGQHITGIWLDGVPLQGGTTYSVTVNSFLASGGDNFETLTEGANPTDTGQIDLQAMVEYMDQFGADNPLAVDYSQHSVGVTSLGPGQLHLSSLMMTGPDDVRDTQVAVTADGESLGTFPLECTTGTVPYDEYGTTTVHLPSDSLPDELVVTGNRTGTEIRVAVPERVVLARSTSPRSNCLPPLAEPTLKAKVKQDRIVVDKTKAKVIAVVKVGTKPATGKIRVRAGGRTYRARLNDNGRGVVKLKPFNRIGKKRVRVIYLGNADTKRAVEILAIRVVRR